MSATAVEFPVWSTTARLVVTDPAALKPAAAILGRELRDVDDACSRFRPDSELSLILSRPGSEVMLSPVLNDLIAAALRVTRMTGGLVDPTVAAAVISLGYDRDIGSIAPGPANVPAHLAAMRLAAASLTAATARHCPAPGAARIRHDHRTRRLLVPAGVGIDLGATAKAVAADRAAGRILAEIGGGVLVSLGGDIAVAGPAPDGGWRVAIGVDHRTAQQDPEEVVTIFGGGLATSATATRSWLRHGRTVHHIIDPRTGENPEPCWRSASAVAASCLEANAASTAAIVLGRQAPTWLAARGIAARLRAETGGLSRVAGWPLPVGLVA